jgi:hypothetical protein
VLAGVAVNPRTSREGSKGIDVTLQEARARYVRLAPEDTYTELVARMRRHSWWILDWWHRGSGKAG